MILEKKLEQLGLSDKESKVYVSLLELGQATAAQVALKSGIKRATTYVMLEALKGKGLASMMNKDKKTFFVAEDPDQISKYLKDQKKDLDDKLEQMSQIIPELKLIRNLTAERTKVKFLEGREGVRILQQDLIRSKINQFDNISNINLVLEIFPISKEDHRQDFYRKKWSTRVIFTYDAKKGIPDLKGIEGEKRRYLPQDKFPVYSDIMIYGNKVSMVTLRHSLLGVIIENEEIAQTLKSLFELAWAAAEKEAKAK